MAFYTSTQQFCDTQPLNRNFYQKIYIAEITNMYKLQNPTKFPKKLNHLITIFEKNWVKRKKKKKKKPRRRKEVDKWVPKLAYTMYAFCV